MLGAIIGDIAGSIYEFNPIKTKDFPLFSDGCTFTDDSVMTAAVCALFIDAGGDDEWVKEHIAEYLRKWARWVPLDPFVAGYGGRFHQWLRDPTVGPYGSFGNGSAMRVSSIGWLARDLEQAEYWAKLSAEVTHNHPEGIRGAQAVACAIWMARRRYGRKRIKQYIEDVYRYDLSKPLDEIREPYSFDETCQGTVPPAMISWLESDSYEDAIRNAISLGGDADTLAAITGSIAEAEMGIPPDVAAEGERRLPALIRDQLVVFREEVGYEPIPFSA